MFGLAVMLVSAASASDEGCRVDLDVAAEDAVAAVTDDEHAWAREIVDTTLARVSCLSRVADPEDLATLYLARAAAAFYATPRLPWVPDLLAAAALHPGWFNDRLGPDLRLEWEAASTKVTGEASLSAAPIPDDGVFYVDGVHRLDQPVSILPGPHLVQVSVGAEVAFAWFGELTDGQALALETGLPEPTRARPFRDNPLLVAGLGLGAATAGAWYPVWSYGSRFEAGNEAFQGTAAVTDQARDWRRFRAMEAGLAAGSAAAVGMLTGHLVLKVREHR